MKRVRVRGEDAGYKWDEDWEVLDDRHRVVPSDGDDDAQRVRARGRASALVLTYLDSE